MWRHEEKEYGWVYIAVLFLFILCCNGCARVKMNKLEYGSYKGGSISFQNEFRVNAKYIKATKKIMDYCAPLNPVITGGSKDMRYDSGPWFPSPRYGIVEVPGSYEEWVTVDFKCVWGDGT